MKGCTAAYDFAAEFPLPSVDGLSAMAKAYEEVGMRAVLAPMVADITFFEAIPGLMERLSPSLQKEVESFRYAPWKAIARQMGKALQKWPFEKVVLAVAPTIPHHCSDDFLIACRNLAREYDVGSTATSPSRRCRSWRATSATAPRSPPTWTGSA